MSKRQNLITQITHHSLEVKLAKTLIRKFNKLKEPTEKFFSDRNHKLLVGLTEITVELQLEIDRHMKILTELSKQLLHVCKLTTEIDAESIVPFKLKDIERGYVHIESPTDEKNKKT